MITMSGIQKMLLRPVNPSSILIQGLFAIVAGIWLMFPWDTFATSESYTVMGMLAPDWALGVLILAVGLVMLWGALTNSATKIVWTGWIGFFIWLVIAILIFLSNPYGITWILCLGPASHAAYIVTNVRVNRGLMPLSR